MSSRDSKRPSPDSKPHGFAQDSTEGQADELDHDARGGHRDEAHAGAEGEAEERAGRFGFGETFKKLFSVGTAAAFMTEESIRQTLGEMKLPSNIIQTILSNASKSKEELMNRVGTEVTKVISKIDFVKEATKFIETHKFKISAEIEVKKKESDRD